MKKSGKRKLRKRRKRYQSSDAIEKVEGAKTERQNDEQTIEKRRRVVWTQSFWGMILHKKRYFGG